MFIWQGSRSDVATLEGRLQRTADQIQAEIVELKTNIQSTSSLLRADTRDLNGSVQAQISELKSNDKEHVPIAFHNEFRRQAEIRLAAIVEQVKTIETEIKAMRLQFLTQEEFRQFGIRIDALIRRVDVNEGTRITAGELKGTIDGFDKAIQALSTRVGQLETKSYEAAGNRSRNPVEASELVSTTANINKQIDMLQQQISNINNQLHATHGMTKMPSSKEP